MKVALLGRELLVLRFQPEEQEEVAALVAQCPDAELRLSPVPPAAPPANLLWYCLVCGRPGTWARSDVAYCADHWPS